MPGPRSKRKRPELEVSTPPPGGGREKAPSGPELVKLTPAGSNRDRIPKKKGDRSNKNNSNDQDDDETGAAAPMLTSEQTINTIPSDDSQLQQDKDAAASNSAPATVEGSLVTTNLSPKKNKKMIISDQQPPKQQLPLTAQNAVVQSDEGNDQAAASGEGQSTSSARGPLHIENQQLEQQQQTSTTNHTNKNNSRKQLNSRGNAANSSGSISLGGSGNGQSSSGVATKNVKSSSSSSSTQAQRTSTSVGKGPASRQERIRKMLEHRKLLLARVQQTRASAQARLEQMLSSEEDPTIKSETDEQERLRFAAFARDVTSQARRQNRSVSDATLGDGVQMGAGGAEKRTSVSLRRGSSVGEKMNAALSSLAPGSAAAAAAAAASGNSGAVGNRTTSPPGTVQRGTSLPIQATGANNALIASNPPHSVSSANPSLAEGGNVPMSIAGSSNIPTAPMVQRSVSVPMPSTGGSNKRSLPMAGTGVPASNVAVNIPRAGGVGQKGLNRQQQQQQMGAAPNMVLSSRNPALHGQMVPMATGNLMATNTISNRPTSAQQPLLIPANITGMPMRRPVPPVVAVPEAMELRERKALIEQKLLTMSRKRSREEVDGAVKESAATTTSSPSSVTSARSSAAAVTNDNSGQPLSKTAPTFALSGSCPPSRLPKRRRTHWDNLLDEMRWLATDFMEERKWKESTSRAMARALCRKAEEPRPSLGSSDKSNNMEVDTEVISEEEKDKKGVGATAKPKPSASDKTKKKKKSIEKMQTTMDASHKRDEAAARDIARRTSSAVAEYWSSAATGDDDASETVTNVEQSTDDVEMASSEEKGDDKKDDNESSTPKEADDHTSKLQAQAAAVAAEREKRHEEYAQMSQRLENLLEEIEAYKKNGSKMKSFGVDLVPRQASSVGFSEEIWKKNQVGCLLAGPSSSGKTFAICSILWKHKSHGPQLVLCSPGSLVKWFDELSYFDGISVKGAQPTDIGEANNKLETTTVVICSYSDFSQMNREILSQFRTVVLDTRYPVGFRGSRPKICLDSYENSNHSLMSIAAPREIGSTGWWENVVTCIMQTNAKRIMVDPFGSDDLLGLLEGFSDRMVLEHLALRMAFLYGKSVFPTTWKKYGKNTLGWARSYIKGAKNYSAGGSKFVKVRQLLSSTLDTVAFHLVTESTLQPSLEVLACEMTASQRESYELCCNNVKTSLSRQMDNFESDGFKFQSAANALMDLRRICTHADMRGITKRLPNTILQQKRNNPSQPDMDLATNILAGSGKFHELIRILVQEADVSISDEVRNAIEIDLSPKTGTDSREHDDEEEDEVKKVAILAILPEVQFIASVLLDSLGITHEVLLDDEPSSSPHDGEDASSAWLATQLVLSRFNDKVTDYSDLVNIIIASPTVVAGNHGGLGVESADVVILLDEDWSGRGELLMRSLVSRLTFGKEEIESKLWRLVAENSCEENFVAKAAFRKEGSKVSSENLKPWPVSSLGVLHPPKDLRPKQKALVLDNWNGDSFIDGIFVFPGTGMVSCSNETLEKVLGTRVAARQLFGSMNEPKFLPSLDVTSEVRLMECMSKMEEIASSFQIISPSLKGNRISSTIPPRANDFTSEYGLKALQKLPVVAFLHRFVSGTVPLQPEDTLLAGSSLPSTAGGTPAKVPEREARTETTVEEAEKPPIADPDVPADGLLFYKGNEGSLQLSSQNYHNAFASLYRMSSTELQSKDGAQGTEMLVYFPPLFPRLLESSMIAAESVDSLRNSIPRDSNRMLVPDPSQVSNKRLKADNGEYIPACLTAASAPVVTEEEASRSDAASVLLDLTEDYGLAGIGAIPLPRDSALSSGLMTIENSSNVLMADAADTVDFVSNEVAEGEERRGFNAPINNSNSVILFVSRKRPRAPMHILQPPLRSHMAINSNQPGPWGTNPAPNLVSSSGALYGVGEAESTKKTKKKIPPLNDAPTALATAIQSRPLPATDPQKSSLSHANVPNGMPNSVQSTKLKDMHRSRLIAASRQTGPGTTLFEATPFRAAAVRLKNKMSIRIGRYCWQSGPAFEIGPGLPLIVSKPQQGRAHGFRGQFDVDPALWTSVVKRLKNSKAMTGDEAIEVSLGQKSGLRRSLSAPSRVDFGPFQCGFLSSPSGMTAISAPRPILGVSLPMGVKLPQTSKDQNIPWRPKEEEILKKTVVRFGTNWTIASRVLTGLQDVVTVSRQPQSDPPSPRAAKSCKEHWQVLARGDPALTREMKKLERTQRERSALPFSQSPDQSIDFSIIEPPTNDTIQDANANKSHLPSFLSYSVASTTDKGTVATADEEKTTRKRSFFAIEAARKKSQEAPRAIPGMNADGPVNMAPTHQSHMQSVQSSVSSAWTSGRTEMWPLQFLDTADRYRAQQAHHSSVPNAPTPSHGVPPSSRQQVSHSSSMSRTASSGGRTQSSTSASAQKLPVQPQSSSKDRQVGSTPRSGHISQQQTKPAAHKSFAPPPSQQQQPASTSSRPNANEAGGEPARK